MSSKGVGPLKDIKLIFDINNQKNSNIHPVKQNSLFYRTSKIILNRTEIKIKSRDDFSLREKKFLIIIIGSCDCRSHKDEHP